MFDYFNNNLKHSYFLNGVTYAKGVNEKLDAFILAVVNEFLVLCR